MKKFYSALTFFLVLPQFIFGVEEKPSADISLRNEVQHAIERGANWLKENQSTNGYWGTGEYPAITALALVALQGSPEKISVSQKRGYEFLAGCAKPDGSIYNKKELLNYNTSLSLIALVGAKQNEFRPIILKARKFLIGSQIEQGEPGKTDTFFDGGIGYGSKYEHSDLSNTLLALEALYYSKAFAKEDPDAKDLNWKAAIQFIQNCQNLPEFNKQAWVAEDAKNKGGFIYFPGSSMAGETNLPSGRVALRSYGSMSYAGLLSYIYADIKTNDPRVEAVAKWLSENYTLDENPGMGPQGIFYYFHTMSKALSLAGINSLDVKGKKINWRKDLALKLVNLQKKDGSWLNESARWRENDPVLVTCYAIISLEMILQKL